jgi:acyl-CoA synthetase
MPEWVAFVTKFPLTPSGKILKRELINMHKSGALAPLAVRFEQRKEA